MTEPRKIAPGERVVLETTTRLIADPVAFFPDQDPPGPKLWTYSGPPGFGQKAARNEVRWRDLKAHRENLIPLAEAWRAAAVADGWEITPTYGAHEPVDRAWRLRKSLDGLWTVQGITRPGDDRALPTASIHIWGPDGLAVRPPLIYSMAALIAGARTCAACGATDVATQRFSFAGRCCAACRPAMAAAHEQGNWTE